MGKGAYCVLSLVWVQPGQRWREASAYPLEMAQAPSTTGECCVPSVSTQWGLRLLPSVGEREAEAAASRVTRTNMVAAGRPWARWGCQGGGSGQWVAGLVLSGCRSGES